MATARQRIWNQRRPEPSGLWKPRKLTNEQCAEITRRLGEGESPLDLATEYGVTASRIRQLR